MSEKVIDKGNLSEFEKKLCEKVEERRDEIVELLKDLISIDSRSYDWREFSDMHKVFEFAQNYMEKIGFETELYKAPHRLEEENKGKKEWPNLLAYIKSKDYEGSTESEGKKGGKFLQFNGHLDIVPYREEHWDEDLSPLKAVVKDGKIYGRGTCDMKGGLAAQMIACKLFKEMDLPFQGKLQMWFIPDEELDGLYGAQYMAKNHFDKVNADGTIIAEPSGQPPIKSPAIVVGEKGHKWLEYVFHGSSGHGSLPKPKSNSINKAAKFINKSNKWKLPKVKSPIGLWDLVKALFSRFSLGELIKALKSVGDEEPDPYMEDGLPIKHFFNTSVSFTMIEGGSKTNVIPDTCSFRTDIRVLPGISDQDIYSSIAEYGTYLGYRVKLPEGFKNPQESNRKMMKRPVDIEINPISTTDGTFVDPNKDFAQLLKGTFEDVYKRNAVFFFAPGGTDAVHMRMENMENVLIFGPSGFNAHDANESVVIDELVNTCKVFLVTAYRMLGKK